MNHTQIGSLLNYGNTIGLQRRVEQLSLRLWLQASICHATEVRYLKTYRITHHNA